jgi:hypothetical protein
MKLPTSNNSKLTALTPVSEHINLITSSSTKNTIEKKELLSRNGNKLKGLKGVNEDIINTRANSISYQPI